jgi:hypothetical protein
LPYEPAQPAFKPLPEKDFRGGSGRTARARHGAAEQNRASPAISGIDLASSVIECVHR